MACHAPLPYALLKCLQKVLIRWVRQNHALISLIKSQENVFFKGPRFGSFKTNGNHPHFGSPDFKSEPQRSIQPGGAVDTNFGSRRCHCGLEWCRAQSPAVLKWESCVCVCALKGRQGSNANGGNSPNIVACCQWPISPRRQDSMAYGAMS